MDTIPEDVWPLMVKFMDDKTKRQMRLANTKWFNIIKYDDFKLYFTRTENIGAISDRLSQYSWPIKVSFIKSKIDNALELINNLPKLTNMVEISSDGFMTSKFDNITHDQWMQLSTLTNLQLWSINSAKYYMPQELFKKIEKYIEYEVHNDNDDDESKPNLKQMTDLQALKFFAASTTWPYAMVPNPEKLTKLVMGAELKFENGEEALPHLTNLKVLTVSDYNCYNTLDLSYLTALEKCYIQENLPSFETNTNLTNLTVKCQLSPNDAGKFSTLKKLRYFDLFITEKQQETIDFRFLSDLQQLDSFEICKPKVLNEDIIPTTLFQNLSPNLKELRASHLQVQFSNLTHLTNLEVLDLNTPLLDVQIISQLSKLTKLHLLYQDEDQSWKAIEKLTNLENLAMTAQYNEFHIMEENLPNIGGLMGLTRLDWVLEVFPKRILDQLALLTTLTQLTITPSTNNRAEPLENCNFLQELTNLVKLSLVVAVKNGLIWRNVSALTKLEYLDVSIIYDDEELLSLTAMTNLRYLMVRHAEREFNGVHLTALTSLQSISFPSTDSPLIHEYDSLHKTMPYLLRLDTYWNGTPDLLI